MTYVNKSTHHAYTSFLFSFFCIFKFIWQHVWEFSHTQNIDGLLFLTIFFFSSRGTVRLRVFRRISIASTVHIVHHGAATVIHLLLSHDHVLDLFANLETFRHWALISFAIARVKLDEILHAQTQATASGSFGGASKLVRQKLLHLLAISRCARWTTSGTTASGVL